MPRCGSASADAAEDRNLWVETQSLALLALNSAPLASRDPATGELVDQTRYLGAFVTPDDSEIDPFLKRAADFLPEGESFAGYAGSVTAQVKALYEALAARDTKYVDSTLDFNPDKAANATQRVRLPKQALTAKVANCLDGTLLFASLLERVGIEPAIVIVPGHALVAWATTKKRHALALSGNDRAGQAAVREGGGDRREYRQRRVRCAGTDRRGGLLPPLAAARAT